MGPLLQVGRECRMVAMGPLTAAVFHLPGVPPEWHQNRGRLEERPCAFPVVLLGLLVTP